MIALEQAAVDYLTLRRAFGYKLVGHDRLLADFSASLQHAGLDTVTIDAALSWAVSPARSDAWHALRLRVVRGFARYLHTLDPSCQVPPPRGLRGRTPACAPAHLHAL